MGVPQIESLHLMNRRMRAALGRGVLLSRGGLSEPLLYGPRQFLLPAQLDVGVVVGHIDAAVTRNLAGLDGAGTNLLPPGDVRTPQGVQTKARKVTGRFGRGNLQRLAYTGIPHRPLRIVFLREDPLIGIGDVFVRNPSRVARNQRP